MAKGPLITAKGRQEIAEAFLAHQEWRAKEVQAEVTKRLGGKGPGLSAVQKELTRLRKTHEGSPSEQKELDLPWSVGARATREGPGEALEVLLSIQHRRRTEGRPLLTVREALWIAHLHNIRSIGGPGRSAADDLNILATWGQAYSIRERVCELNNVVCDTSDLDEGILGSLQKTLDDWLGRVERTCVERLKKSGRPEDAREYFSPETDSLHVAAIETKYLGYSLGDLDMDKSSAGMYRTILMTMPDITDRLLQGITIDDKKAFFLCLRAWVAEDREAMHFLDDRPDISDDDPLNEKVARATDFATISIIAEIMGKTPASEIPLKAHERFKQYMADDFDPPADAQSSEVSPSKTRGSPTSPSMEGEPRT